MSLPKPLIMALLAGVLFVAFTGTRKVYNMTRGLRNNNPGNIRHSGAAWIGKAPTQPDKSFVTFTAPEYGIRALAVVLKNYQKKYGLDTIEKIIARWAPPNENDTTSYIKAVSKQAGIPPGQKIVLNADTLEKIVPAIIKHENGLNPYSAAEIKNGISRA